TPVPGCHSVSHCRWDPSLQDSNIVVCTAFVTDVLIHRGWHYLSCPWCSKQVSVKAVKIRCSQCDIEVDSSIARFMVRFQVEDLIGCTVFIALDSEVKRLVCQSATELLRTPEEYATASVLSGFSQVLNRPLNFQIALRPFHQIKKVATNFAVTCIYPNTIDESAELELGGAEEGFPSFAYSIKRKENIRLCQSIWFNVFLVKFGCIACTISYPRLQIIATFCYDVLQFHGLIVSSFKQLRY
ncbi:hypothetical protein MKX01_014677, partial [Papaver californicum]